MIQNIIFDIGNVLVTFDPYTYFLKYFKEETKTRTLCELMFSHEAWSQYDAGILLRKDLYEIYHQAYPQYQEEMDHMLTHWLKLMEPIPETLACMKELKQQGYGIYLLSNISQDSADYLKKTQDFFAYADGAVLSYELHTIKPDAAIYEELLRRYHLEPATCVFLDDGVQNIEKACSLGMQGIVVCDIQTALQELKELLEGEKVC
ncbi:MAG: HAD family hydrolase [Longicatena caecimuris]|uniref:HAD family hydrolase n=1 Tax=Longicatena caecimuris TaxID=1796635 RepID=UPI00399AEF48